MKENLFKKIASVKFVSRKHWISCLIPIFVVLLIACLPITIISLGLGIIVFMALSILIIAIFIFLSDYIQVSSNEELVIISDGEEVVLPKGRYFLFPYRNIAKEKFSLKTQNFPIMTKEKVNFAHEAEFEVKVDYFGRIQNSKDYYINKFVVQEIMKCLIIYYFEKRSYKIFITEKNPFVIENLSIIDPNGSVISFIENNFGIKIYSIVFTLLNKIKEEDVDENNGDGC